jgi:hypothetical protein
MQHARLTAIPQGVDYHAMACLESKRMTDEEIQRILDEDCPLGGILLTSGGLMRPPVMTMSRVVTDARYERLWRVNLLEKEGHDAWDTLYVRAENIVALLLWRQGHDLVLDEEEQHEVKRELA